MYDIDITDDQVIETLATFIEPFVLGAEIVQAQQNRVAMPQSPCVILTKLRTTDLGMPYANYFDNVNYLNLTCSTRIDIQVDFYGQVAGQFCRSIKNAFNSLWGFNKFPSNIKPLFMSDGIQMPLITGEEQYEERWTSEAFLQINPTTVLPQDYSDELHVNIFEAADLL